MTNPVQPRGTFTPKLGKAPARPGAVKLTLSSYLSTALPAAPRAFGHYDLFPEDGWGMLGNDQYGDCVLAGGDHEHMLWNKVAGKDVAFDEATALQDYSRITGFSPHDPSTDQGTDMEAAAAYRRKVGLIDASGRRHPIQAYAAVGLTSSKLAQAAHLFGAVGVGIQFPASAMDQFNEGKVWTATDSAIEGGHYVPLVGRKGGKYAFLTWGHLQWATSGFVKKYVDEALVYFTPEMLTAGKSPEGFDTATLLADLKQVTSA